MTKKTEETNKAVGICSIIIGLFIPIAGLILGIIATSKKDEDTTLGIIGLVMSIISWGFWIVYFLGGTI